MADITITIEGVEFESTNPDRFAHDFTDALERLRRSPSQAVSALEGTLGERTTEVEQEPIAEAQVDSSPELEADTKEHYFGRVYRHKSLMPKIIRDVEVMVYAMLRPDQAIRYDEIDLPVAGFPHAPNYKWRARVGQWCGRGRTRETALIDLLRVIFDHGGWFPKT